MRGPVLNSLSATYHRGAARGRTDRGGFYLSWAPPWRSAPAVPAGSCTAAPPLSSARRIRREGRSMPLPRARGPGHIDGSSSGVE